ncbi:hypothetical protein MTR_4g123790 [Medicago truncatula]|uniref:Uncharacterized protein n=1 Tax=Medicago truncatula TaxID=3880 RepID=G7JQ27_MEDTR|nr:hypothetical protein MTR_4g123790 [Medicago truncatula]
MVYDIYVYLVQKSLIMMKHVLPYKQVWDIKDFSKLDSECCDSKPFNISAESWHDGKATWHDGGFSFLGKALEKLWHDGVASWHDGALAEIAREGKVCYTLR